MRTRVSLVGIVFGVLACGDSGVKPDHISDSGRYVSGSSQPDDSGEPGPIPEHSRLRFGPVVDCEAPQDRVTYVDESVEWGIADPLYTVPEHSEGGAIAAADFDDDGDTDIMFFFREEAPILYTRTDDAFIGTHLDASSGVTQLGMADLNSDGRLDLMLGGFEPEVLLNLSSGWETVPFPVSSFTDETSVTKSMHPMDIDGDGFQDAYVLMTAIDTSGTAGMDVIAWGNGDGTFVLDESIVPTDWGHQKGFDVQWFDWDGDGWQDVYVVNELPTRLDKSLSGNQANFLLRNNGGTLELANEACACDISMDGMGAGLGDYNNDGLPDLFLTATGKNALLSQLPDGSYVDVGRSTGADTLDGTLQSMAWGGIFVDFDNDGLLDVAVAEGDLWHEFSTNPYVADMPLNLVRQVEPERFEIANEHGFGQMGSWRSIVPSDLNGDGVLDFIVGDVQDRPMLLMSQGCTTNSWLEVAAPHGSRVEIDVNGHTRVGWSNSASSFGAVREPMAHFGLGVDEAINGLRIDLPDGEVIELDEIVEGRRFIRVKSK